MYGNIVRRVSGAALVQVGLIALAYWGTGTLGLLLAIPPGYATAIWPPAGIAFAATLMCGARVWPGLVLGSFLVNVGTTFDAATVPALLTSLALPLSIGVGAALQAQGGAVLVRRAVGFPPRLEHAREVVAFLVLGGPVSCLISATWGVTSLLVGGVILWTSALLTWWTWWVGDTIGVLMVLPLLLVWRAEPRQYWRQRWCSVAVPLGLTILLVVAAEQTWDPWTVLASGVLFVGLSGTLLLVLTGHTLSMERLVAERTATNATLAHEITERIEMEAVLRDSEARKGAIVEAAIDGIITIDQEGKILEFNPAAERLLGYPRSAAVGQLLADLIIPPSLRERHRRGLAHYLATGEGPVLGKRLEMSALRADGTEFPVELSITRVGTAEPVRFTGFLRDITERQRAEAQVLQQLARLALLHRITRAIGERQDLDSIFLVVLSRLEQDLPITFGCFCLGSPGSDTLTVTAVGVASQALTALLGLEAQTVLPLGQNGLRACLDGQTVWVPDTAQVALPLLQRFAQAGLRSLIATPLVVEDSLFGLLLVARRNAAGFSSGESEFLRQVSEHVALAAHHVDLYTKLQQAYDDLHQSQQIVMQQERLRALGQMASGIAHDINNAISPITLYVESLLASDATLSARARDYLTTVQQAANDVAHTVARLREFYRQPVGLQEARPVDLNQIVPQVVELTRAKWRDEPQRLGVTIIVHTALQQDGLPLILGVESELREALINLIFNAVDAMPHGGRLTVQTRATPTAVILEVLDTGIGMDETTRQRCLEPFYTTKDVRGTGLGLAMVYGMSERHGAQLVIESAVGQGTTVRLLFPIALSQGERDDQPVEVEASASSLRILVVDDDPLLRRLLQDVLQTEGHVVTVVEGGRVALAALQGAQERREPFDVVITDLGMPEMDGREVARGVKHVAPDTPVVLLTGWGQALQQDETLPPYVDHLLSKPPGLRELRAALRAVSRPAGREDNHDNN